MPVFALQSMQVPGAQRSAAPLRPRLSSARCAWSMAASASMLAWRSVPSSSCAVSTSAWARAANWRVASASLARSCKRSRSALSVSSAVIPARRTASSNCSTFRSSGNKRALAVEYRAENDGSRPAALPFPTFVFSKSFAHPALKSAQYRARRDHHFVLLAGRVAPYASQAVKKVDSLVS